MSYSWIGVAYVRVLVFEPLMLYVSRPLTPEQAAVVPKNSSKIGKTVRWLAGKLLSQCFYTGHRGVKCILN